MAKKRDFLHEYQTYQGTAEQRKNRSSRNKARRLVTKSLGTAAVAGKDVDHKDGNPKNNNRTNLGVKSKSSNRSRK